MPEPDICTRQLTVCGVDITYMYNMCVVSCMLPTVRVVVCLISEWREGGVWH